MKSPYLTSMMGLFVAVAAFALSGCTSDEQAICEDTVNCRGGSDRDIEACVVAREVDAALVDEIGCNEEYELYFTCITEKATCQSVEQGVSCTTDEDCSGTATCNSDNQCAVRAYSTDGDDCRPEGRAFGRCFDLD